MANKEIRDAIKKTGLYKYQVAYLIGVNDCTFSKYLRRELPTEKRDQILSAIESLTSERVKEI